jgi:hypothetical protein
MNRNSNFIRQTSECHPKTHDTDQRNSYKKKSNCFEVLQIK